MAKFRVHVRSKTGPLVVEAESMDALTRQLNRESMDFVALEALADDGETVMQAIYGAGYTWRRVTEAGGRPLEMG